MVSFVLEKLFEHNVGSHFEGAAPFIETLRNLVIHVSWSENLNPPPLLEKKRIGQTYAFKHTVICPHSPGHSEINSIPDGLQSSSGNMVRYQPGVGLGPNPSLVCGDKNGAKPITVLSSRRKWSEPLARPLVCGGHRREDQVWVKLAFEGFLPR